MPTSGISRPDGLPNKAELVLTITPSPHIVFLDGVACRMWKGIARDGTECIVYVHRVASDDPELNDLLELVLSETDHPKDHNPRNYTLFD